MIVQYLAPVGICFGSDIEKSIMPAGRIKQDKLDGEQMEGHQILS